MNVKFHKITSSTYNFQNFTCDTNQNSIDSTKRNLTRTVASGRARGELPPRNFSETYLMTSAENSVSEPPDLTIFWGGYPQTPYKARDLSTFNNAHPL